MNIEVFYIPDCPGHAPALDSVKRIVSQCKVKANIRSVQIADTSSSGFRGSPTICVNGKDIEATDGGGNCGAACRTYASGGKLLNVPPDELIRQAILRESRSSCITGAAAPLFAITAALASVACCLPFGIAGALGAIGLSLYLQSQSTWVICVAVFFLAVAAFQLYRQRRSMGRVHIAAAGLFAIAVAVVGAMIVARDQVALFFAQLSR